MAPHFPLRAPLGCADLQACPQWGRRQVSSPEIPQLAHEGLLLEKLIPRLGVCSQEYSLPLRNFISYLPSFSFFKKYLLIEQDTQSKSMEPVLGKEKRER